MPFPNYPDKHDAPAVATPDAAVEYSRDRPPADALPGTVLLCYNDGVFESFADRDDASPVEGAGALHRVDGTDVGVVGGFGIGAPAAVVVMEELATLGVERFCSVGWAGALDPALDLGDVVVPDRAVRDEGVSHHYLPSATYADASLGLVSDLEGALRARGDEYRIGATWTTDAPFRETVPEVEEYRRDGVLTVDMEAAATFAVAAYRGLDAGALFTVSDFLDPDGWEPAFYDASEHLRELLDAAVEALG